MTRYLDSHQLTSFFLACLAGWILVHGFPGTANIAKADEWMTWGSTYTHDPVHQQRVDQYTQPVQPTAPVRSDFRRSGYRNYRSTLQAGRSADNIHIVEQWGEPVVPYEHWRFPYRPYGVPYDLWGPQLPAVIGGNPWWGAAPRPRPGAAPGRGMGRGGYQYPPGTFPGLNGNQLVPPYNNQPWFDGTYPQGPPLDPRTDEEFFYRPPRAGGSSATPATP